MQLPEWAMTLIALGSGLGGLFIGYALGFRNGAISGELRALHITLQELRSRRRNAGHTQSEHPVE